jgi:hypothetical protein
MVICDPRRTVQNTNADISGLFQVSAGILIGESCYVCAARTQAIDVVTRFKSSVVTTIVGYDCGLQVFSRVRNKICLSCEVPFDRSSLHSWFLH